jgi:hypothetical protein
MTDDTIIRELEDAMKSLELQEYETSKYWDDNKKSEFYRFLEKLRHDTYNYKCEFKQTDEQMENWLYNLNHS